MLNTLSEKTTVDLKRKTRDQLAALGKKDSTFDEIIQELLGVK